MKKGKGGCEDCEPLEERVPEPEPLQGNEDQEEEGGPVLGGRLNGAKPGGGLSLLVSPEFKRCWL